jgi:RING-variant domain
MKSEDNIADDFCWICLGEDQAEKLIQPCKCPRKVHSQCLHKWQIMCMGKDEEQVCRFCKAALPDWTKMHEATSDKTIRISIECGGVKHYVRAQMGKFNEFQSRVRHLYGMSDDDEFAFCFRCPLPDKCKLSVTTTNETQEDIYNKIVLLTPAIVENK